MKTEIPYARRVNQKLANADVLLSQSQTVPDRFTSQSLVESVYLQLELALGFYLSEVLAKYGAGNRVESSDAFDIDGLVSSVRNPQADMFEVNELRLLSAEPDSWFSHCAAICRSFRCVGDQDSQMKSSLFDKSETSIKSDSNLIAVGAAIDAGNEPSVESAQSTLQKLKEFIERNRASGVEC